ncbi:MAG: CDP-alcohol phosphatidyltransferase family protein [Flavobacteriales bacterium]
MPKEKIFNIPNLLSFYRLLTFPFILWMVYAGEETMFATFLCINLVTDILDGLIARTFKLQTQFGARLDSLADNGTYILAFLGIYQFKMEELSDTVWMLWLFLAIFILGNLVSFVKFKKWPSLHLYSTKTGGYVQGIFFFCLFAFDYYPALFYGAMAFGYFSWIEEIVILLILKEMQSDVKGLYWVLKEMKKREAA